MNGSPRVTSRARFSDSQMAGSGARWVGRICLALLAGGLSWWHFSTRGESSPDRTRLLVTSLGWIGAGLALLAASLSARKRLAYQGAGRLSVWTNAHIYLGTGSAFATLLHTGFGVGGPLPTLLLMFFWLTAASGVMGWWLSKALPPLLTAIEETPAIIEDLLAKRAECLRGMLELSAGGSGDFGAFIQQKLMPETASWIRMFRFYWNRSTFTDEISGFQKEHEWVLHRLGSFEHHAVQRAVEYALRVNKMNAELFLHRILRGWLTLHITATATMFGLLAVHIASVLYY